MQRLSWSASATGHPSACHSFVLFLDTCIVVMCVGEPGQLPGPCS